MKTISTPKAIVTKTTILIIALIFSTTVFFANTTPRNDSANSATEKTIHDYFKFPSVLMPVQNGVAVRSQKVEVVFTTDVSGHVNFVLAKTNNRMLKQEIEKQFSALMLPRVKNEVVHSVTLNFRTL